MPEILSGPKKDAAKKKKKGGFGSWLRKQGSDLADVATGAPGALYESAKAIDQALPPSPVGPLERLLFEREGRHLDPTALKEQGAAQLAAARKLGDPKAWRDETALNLLTALGIAGAATGVGGAVGRTASAARAGKRVPKKPPSRVLSYKARNVKEAERLAKAGKFKGGKVTRASVEVPAAGPILTRTAQKGVDKVRAKVPPWQRRKVEAQLRMEADIRDRMNEAVQPGFVGAVKQLKKGDFKLPKRGYASWEGVRDLNALARGLILFRPGYIPPNLIGAVATNLIHMGADLPRQVVRGRRITSDLTPEERARMRSLHGSGISQSALDMGAGSQGPLSTFMSGVGESLGKVTDRRSRDRAFLAEAEKFGYKTSMDIKRLLDPDDVPSKRDLIQIVKRVEPRAIKFSRTSGGNALDRALAQNIFLYKWLTGSGRYTGHVLGEHPTLTGALANMPQGTPLSELVNAAVPGFAEGFIPYGTEGDLPKVINPQSLSLWETIPEAMETARGVSRRKPLDVIRHLAPVQKFGAQAVTGYNPSVGKNITGFNEETGRAIYSPYMNASPMDQLRFAAEEAVSMSPYSKIAPRFRSSLFPSNTSDEALRLLLGGIMPRQYDPSIGAFIASAEGRERKGGKNKSGRKKKARY
jgi:hypothetical protein